MRIRNVLFLSLSFSAACTSDAKQLAPVHLPPHGGVVEPDPHTFQAPSSGIAFGDGPFHYLAMTAPGTASFDAAAMTPPDTAPTTLGGGDYDVTLSGTTYARSLSSEALVYPGDGGDDYLVVGGYNEYQDSNNEDTVDQVIAIVKKSDFAVGATVALDGTDRIVLFGSGPALANEPTIQAAAVTGSITFTAGSIDPTGTVTATVSGDFGPIDWGTGSTGTGTITPGNYNLAVQGPAQVECEGTLAGSEASFLAITASDLAFGSGQVAVATPSSSVVTVDGATIAATYGATPLELDDQGGLFAGIADATGSGPLGTSLVGKYLAVDPSSATPTQIYAGAGAGYSTADGNGWCTVAFAATLSQ